MAEGAEGDTEVARKQGAVLHGGPSKSETE